jgi:hypothetical protein
MITKGRTVILVIVVVISLALPRDQRAQAASSVPDARGNPSQSLAIVVNRSNPIDNLSFAELRKIFLGDRNHWPNGHRIAIAMLEYGQPERRAVLRLIYRMDEKAYEDYLLRGMFRGDVFVAPKTLTSPTIVRKFVFNAPGGIGYLRARDVDESVKVVRIDGLLPEDKGYRLQIDESSKETDE